MSQSRRRLLWAHAITLKRLLLILGRDDRQNNGSLDAAVTIRKLSNHSGCIFHCRMIYKLNLRDGVDGQVASLVKTRRRLKDRSKVQAQMAGDSSKANCKKSNNFGSYSNKISECVSINSSL
jgi:hypothetical protein